MLEKTLILPNRKGSGENEQIICREPLVIIGANGSGKSRLGAWIEQNQAEPEKVHRISAQRALDFAEYVPLKSLEQAKQELQCGTSSDPVLRSGVNAAKKLYRWQVYDRPTLSVTPLLNDYEQVLAVLFARKTQRDSELAKRVRKMESEGKHELPDMPESPDEQLIHIWNDILPHRKLIIEDGKITVSLTEATTYHGREMSDGERVALYLMAQSLCVSSDSILIIDEPEIHLHKSLMSRLWSKIEEAKPNCLFIYITHDLDFAASRVGAQKIWIKKYDGSNWIWDETPEEEGLPESVLLEVLGSRKKILFVEGDKGSLDYKIYQAIYPDFLIIPRGGCGEVITSTQAMRNNQSLHHVEAFGLIDMDYRTQKDMQALQESGIFPLNVAEIENILCIPEILEIVARYQMENPDDIYDKIRDFIINNLEDKLEVQVSKRTAAEIESLLKKKFNAKAEGEAKLTESLQSLTTDINVSEIYTRNLELYQDIISEKDYIKALRFYKNKGISKMISRFVNLQNGTYGEFVMKLLSSGYKDQIVAGLRKYAPTIS